MALFVMQQPVLQSNEYADLTGSLARAQAVRYRQQWAELDTLGGMSQGCDEMMLSSCGQHALGIHSSRHKHAMQPTSQCMRE